MVDIYLKADTEAELAAALPWLRQADEDGEDWILGGLHHALDPGIPVFIDGKLAEGFHANLRLLDGHPDRAAILAAAEPFRTEPATPQRTFAGAPEDEPAPDGPTNSDWRVGLIIWGRFAEVEAKVIQARDGNSVEGLIAWQRWEYANNVYRAELMTLKDAFGFTAEDVEESLRRAAQVAALAQGRAA